MVLLLILKKNLFFRLWKKIVFTWYEKIYVHHVKGVKNETLCRELCNKINQINSMILLGIRMLRWLFKQNFKTCSYKNLMSFARFWKKRTKVALKEKRMKFTPIIVMHRQPEAYPSFMQLKLCLYIYIYKYKNTCLIILLEQACL